MLIVGDLSGIQEFVFALPEEEGGQARSALGAEVCRVRIAPQGSSPKPTRSRA
jgi:hypothetical protein